MTEEAQGAGLGRNIGSRTFGVIFGSGQETVQGGRFFVGKVLDSREAKAGQEFLALILPLIPPRNEACQSSNSQGFMRRLW